MLSYVAIYLGNVPSINSVGISTLLSTETVALLSIATFDFKVELHMKY